FRGPIYTNAACADLLPILLRDTAELAMREVERENRDLARGEERVAPLFETADVEAVLRQVQPISFDQPRELFPGITVRVRDAGHILGSSSIEMWLAEQNVSRKLVFSGDLGQYDTPI